MAELSSQLDGGLVAEAVEITDVGTVALPAVDVQPYARIAIWVENISAPGDAVLSGKFQVAPTADGPWVDETVLADVPLDGGDTLFQQLSAKSFKYLRVHLTADAGDLPVVNVWLSVN